MTGKQQNEISEAKAGDIAVAVKISASTSDTLCSPERKITFSRISFPSPCYSMAVKAKAQGDESKISSGIQRLLDEDKTLSYYTDSYTNEQILSGLGEQHLEISAVKLKNKFGVDIGLSVPKIAYRETIRKKVKAEGKYKKQTGGHGQYGHVWIEFEPCVSDELILKKRYSEARCPEIIFRQLKRDCRNASRKAFLQAVLL